MLSGNTSTTTAIDLSRLTPPDIVEDLDFETILADLQVTMTELWPEFSATLESEPVQKLLQVMTWRELIMRQRVNEAARAVMLAYAAGADLDNLAALVGVERLTITPEDPEAGTPAVMESDIELRERVVLAPESFTVAGPTLAYVFHARTAHSDVLDASAISPEPGEVLVTVLSREGNGEPEVEVLEAVEARVNSRSVRPLTDLVTVQAPEIVDYTIEAQIYLFVGPDSSVVLENAQQGVEAYVQLVRKLGRDITRSGLFAALHVEGVQRVELAEPADDIVLDDTQAGNCTAITLEFAGNDD